MHSPLEKAMMNAIECLTNEKEKDIKACLEDLDRLKEIPSREYAFEQLKKGTLTEKLKVELKVLPPHLKYVSQEADDVKLVVINNTLSSIEEALLVEVLKKHKTTIG